jgi:hypothetical protein
MLKNISRQKGEKFPYKAPSPLSSGYCPEIDISPEMNNGDATYYHSSIGILGRLLNWDKPILM